MELVRDIRSEYGYQVLDFKTYALDIGSLEFEYFFKSQSRYDYILNLSAMKHVRSEKDPFSLMRLIEVNIMNTRRTLELAIQSGCPKYFCVSSDKATNPVNMMGASKRIMEFFLMEESSRIDISTARFANVAFSDGSLLHGFQQRIEKRQPIVAPNDVKRYFITPEEAGQLCILSCIQGQNGDIFFPKLNKNLKLTSFSEIAERYLSLLGLKPLKVDDEHSARKLACTLIDQKKWPCFFTESNTTGEKAFEEFFTANETVALDHFDDIGVIKNVNKSDSLALELFEREYTNIRNSELWEKDDLVKLFKTLLPDFDHKELGFNLDEKM